MNRTQLHRLLDPIPFGRTQADRLVSRLTHVRTPDSERAALLLVLNCRPVRGADLAALAAALRRKAVPFREGNHRRPVDLCGTGGSARPTFNVSTVSAFVVAAAGVPVVKHGNRSSRGLTGSSDLLEALGVPVTRSRSFAHLSFRRLRLAFLHAPLFHPALARIGPVRRRLGIPTVFNRLGPLTNPAPLFAQVVGTPDRRGAAAMSDALRQLGRPRSMTFSAVSGRDEFDPNGPTLVYVRAGGDRVERRVDPRAYLDAEDRRGSWSGLPVRFAAAEAERLLAGGGGARRGSVLLTSGAALYTAGFTRSFSGGVAQAATALDSGRAEALLARLRDLARATHPREGG